MQKLIIIIFFVSSIFSGHLFSAEQNFSTSSIGANVKSSSEATSSIALLNTESVKPIRARDIIIHSMDVEDYPTDLSSKGVNGEVILTAKILKSGEMIDIQIKESSRSKELDQAAINYLSKNAIKKERPKDIQLDVNLIFTKSLDVLSLLKATCSDVMPDISYYKSTYADKKLSRMFMMNAFFGSLQILNAQKNNFKPLRSEEDAISIAFDRCQQNPTLPFAAAIHQAFYDKPI